MATISPTFSSNLYRTLFPGFVSNAEGDVYLSGEIWDFADIDRVLPQIKRNFGKFSSDHDSPAETTRKALLNQTQLHVGVNPAWAQGYKKALQILEKTILSDPKNFFEGSIEKVKITLVATHHALVRNTGRGNIQKSDHLAPLAEKVAEIGKKVLSKELPTIEGAASLHAEFANCPHLQSERLFMARIWMNLTLLLGEEKAVMFPSKDGYLKALEEREVPFGDFLQKVADWNEEHKIFA